MNQCVYWRSRNCRKGASCLFAHSADAPLPPCKYGKQCRFGKDCLFGHPDRDVLSNNQHSKQPYCYTAPGPATQYYAGGSSGGSAGGFAGSSGGPPGSLPPSTMGSSAASSSGPSPHGNTSGRGYQSRVPSTSPYGNVQGMQQYATHFQPSPYGHPYSMPMTGYSHAGMSHPERGPYGAPQSSQQRMMPGRTPPSSRQMPSTASPYAAVPSRGGQQGVAPGGGSMAGNSQPTLSQQQQMPPQQQNMRSMENMMPESRAVTQMPSADQDAEAVISSGIQGMAI